MSTPTKRRVPEPISDWFTRMDHEVEELARKRRAKASKKLIHRPRSDQQVTQARMQTVIDWKKSADWWVRGFHKECERVAGLLRDGASVEPGRYRWDEQYQTVIDSCPDLPDPYDRKSTD